MKSSINTSSDGWPKEKKRAKRPGTKSNLLFSAYLNSESATRTFAYRFASILKEGDILCLQGDLGAGKTTFVKGLAQGLGLNDCCIKSPTFSYLNLHETLAHFDLYRLRSSDDFFALGFEEYLTPPFIACIEWPNILLEDLKQPYYLIKLSHEGPGRTIRIECVRECSVLR